MGPRVAVRLFLRPAFTADIELQYRYCNNSPVLCLMLGVPRGSLLCCVLSIAYEHSYLYGTSNTSIFQSAW